MMNIQVQSPDFHPDKKLIDYIEKKYNTLSRMYDRIIDVQVSLRLENAGQIKDKIVETKVSVPGDLLFTRDVEKTFESAVDHSLDMLKRKLVKFKELQRSH